MEFIDELGTRGDMPALIFPGRSAISYAELDLALLLGTSGSTGRSRFVWLSTRAVEANARAIGEYLGTIPGA